MSVATKTRVSSKVTVLAIVAVVATAAVAIGSGLISMGLPAGVTMQTVGCTDPDGGKAYWIQGTTTRDLITLGDTCKDATTLKEAYCDPNNQPAYQEYKCPFGCDVKGKKCVMQCKDTDVTDSYSYQTPYYKNYNVKGVVTDQGVSVADSCKDAKTVNEAFCDLNRGYANSEEHVCISGVCTNGACDNFLVNTTQIPGYGYDIDAQGNTTYILTTEGLYSVDVTNRRRPVIVGSYKSKAFNHFLAIQGKYAYFTSYNSGAATEVVSIIDISNPANLILKGTYTLNINAASSGIAVQGNYLYVDVYDYSAPASVNGVYIVDISNPATPTKVGYYSALPAGNINPIISGNYLYVVTYPQITNLHATQIDVVDVSNPALPTKKKELVLYSTSESKDITSAIMNGSYLYVGSYLLSSPNHDTEMKVISLLDPVNPKAVKTVPNSGYLSYTNGRYIFTSDFLGPDVLNPGLMILGYKVYDITQLTNPLLKRQFESLNDGPLISVDKFLYTMTGLGLYTRDLSAVLQ